MIWTSELSIPCCVRTRFSWYLVIVTKRQILVQQQTTLQLICRYLEDGKMALIHASIGACQLGLPVARVSVMVPQLSGFRVPGELLLLFY